MLLAEFIRANVHRALEAGQGLQMILMLEVEHAHQKVAVARLQRLLPKGGLDQFYLLNLRVLAVPKIADRVKQRRNQGQQVAPLSQITHERVF